MKLSLRRNQCKSKGVNIGKILIISLINYIINK